MSLQPIHRGLTKAITLGVLMIFPVAFLASCSTVGRGDAPPGATASQPANPANAKDKAAERRRWEDRVLRDNALDSSGSEPGYYGSFGSRLSW